MDRTWTQDLTEQLSWHWDNLVRPKLDDLSDAEYLWEPAPGCWNVRRRAEAVTSSAAGSGDWVIDWDFPEPRPAPVTTIAWRLGHVTVGVFGMRNASHFGGPPADYQSTVWPAHAQDAIAQLDDAYGRWIAGVAAFDDADLDRPCGPAEGVFGDLPYRALVLHINREAIHHLAEVMLLRDLYRAAGAVSGRPSPPG
ncbi:MAG TPA: DinB family protein [Acidimicrobiia bacterium]|nr:DinB family protein [Acidimicrobiia bacterium]